MHVTTILTDIDNTLLDFTAGALNTIREGFAEFGLPYTPDVGEAFFRVNNALWRRIETGALTKQELYRIRWDMIFADRGIAADGPAFEKRFRQGINESAVPVDGARELLEYLHGRYRVFAASNAAYEQQEKRLRKAGLLEFFDGLFISDRLGCTKPSPEFFVKCADGAEAEPRNILMLGDSYEADILGAAGVGMRTCLYAPGAAPVVAAQRPDLIVTSLLQVKDIV